ncbi:hypothetical protein KR054_006863 [Drosophila jambulina]|nr:hypothetical protein KR054_006863 [Drosophila jambulina]
MGTLGNSLTVLRERRRFGRQCLFTDRNEMILSIQPSGRMRLKYILRNPINEGTQLSDQMALSTALTHNVVLDSHGLNHFEGGWNIKEVNVQDEESTQRYRKKVEREDSWGIEVNQLIRDVMTISSQNNAINIYEDYFTDLPEDLCDGIKTRLDARAINVFHDLWIPQRTLTTCEWLNNDPHQFVLSYANSKDQKLTNRLPDFGNHNTNAVYVWDVDDPIRPLAHYDANKMIQIAKVCMRNEGFMVGGLNNGQVCYWETADMGAPKKICPLEASHREETTALCWVHNKPNTEFYTGSLDGSIKYWDTRDMVMPTNEVLAEPLPEMVQNRQDAHGVTVMEFEYTIPVRYIIGTDMGYVFVGNRKGLTPMDTITAAYPMFAGPIRSVMRNPFFVKNFLLIGDWRARIWSEEVKNCPSTFYFRSKYQLLSGAWSTGRCSLFVTGDERGNLNFWDLLMSHQKPILTVKFPHAITHLVFRPDGHMLTVCLKNGDCIILRLEEGMRSATLKEKSLIMAMFEREIFRCKQLEAREEEMKLKKRLTAVVPVEERVSVEKIDPKKKKAPVKKELTEVELEEEEASAFLRMVESDTEFTQALLEFNEAMDAIALKRSKRVFVVEHTVFEVDQES